MAASATTALGEASPGLRAELDKAAVACRILEMEGHGSRTQGHLSLRDPEGRGFWLKRWGIAFGEVRDWRDFVLVDMDGKKLAGDGRRHSEWPIHAGVLERRSDIDVVVHSHPRYGRVFSATGMPLRTVANSGTMFSIPPDRYIDTSELIRRKEMGVRMAEALGEHHAVFLRNHGVVFCGADIPQAIMVGVNFEEACRDMLLIHGSGLPWAWPEGEERERKFRQMGSVSGEGTNQIYDFLVRKLARLEAQGHPVLASERVEVWLEG